MEVGSCSYPPTSWSAPLRLLRVAGQRALFLLENVVYQAKHALSDRDAKLAFGRCRARFGASSGDLSACVALLNLALSHIGFSIQNILNDVTGVRYWVFCNKVRGGG